MEPHHDTGALRWPRATPRMEECRMRLLALLLVLLPARTPNLRNDDDDLTLANSSASYTF